MMSSAFLSSRVLNDLLESALLVCVCSYGLSGGVSSVLPLFGGAILISESLEVLIATVGYMKLVTAL